MTKIFPNEEITVNNFKTKVTVKHLKKVFSDDSEALRSFGLLDFVTRWLKRLKKLFYAPVIISYFIKWFINAITPVGVKRFLLQTKLEKNRTSIEKIHILKTEGIVGLDKILSVVINTKNSPDFFKEIIEKYSRQVGFKEVEIIIVDSGSTDKTLDIAREFSCKIVEIKPEEFRHGRSRNIGVKAAKGDYIINTVSDAIPATLDLAYKVAKKMEEEKAAAISVRQIPRFDADLFAVWSIWQHYKYIFGELNQDVWVENKRNFSDMEKQERRKLAIIDDVFVMHDAIYIKKVLYDNDIKYAEDLILSINYINKGYKIGILQSEAVIHSHSREPEYFFKRYFVDANVINDVFSILPNNLTKKDLALNDREFKECLKSIMLLTRDKISELEFDNSWTEKYLNFFADSVSDSNRLKKTWTSLFNEIRVNFNIFFAKTGGFKNGIKDVEARIIVMTSGTLLSEYFMRYGQRKKLSNVLLKFKSLMEGGI